MSMILLPYLGAAAANSEMCRPVAAGKNAKKVMSDPLCDIEMRFTYRTMRVLLAVGAGSGASNRQVADAAGIRDQGQISKLLARLQDVGLVKNIRGQQKKGEANVWILTETGAEVQEVISLQT
jgi:DNA-binding MarR family transcriptional regulator